MFKQIKRCCVSIGVAAISIGAVGCAPAGNSNANCEIYPTVYEGVTTVANADRYAGDVATNLPVQNGVIVSPYYSLTINGRAVPAYATRTANGIHSFAYVDVAVTDTSKGFVLAVEAEIASVSSVLGGRAPEVTVLPESRGVQAKLSGRKVSAEITSLGSFTFVFNKSHEEPLTLFVTQKQERADIVPEGYIVKEFEPGNYSAAQTAFTAQNTVYWFQAGRYQTDSISLPENSVLYLEAGAYLEVQPNEGAIKSAITASSCKNVRVMGRGLLDYSACCGGEVPKGYYNNKSGLVFSQVDDILFEGLTIINSQTWTLCFNDCEGVSVKNCLLFGYRVYADGVMLSDCKNAVVEDCFVRTGDDAFETKSTTFTGKTDNVLFQNNAAWTDKAVAYGCIYESNQDTQNVTFRNCSVGFSLGTWSDHLGCCVVQMGDRKGAKMYDIRFEDIEIFATSNAVCNVFIGGSGGQGPGYGTVQNVYFKNIAAKRCYHYMLNLRAYDSENCFIKDLYLDNITANGVLLTTENYRKHVKISAQYDIDRLHINTLS